MMIDGKQLDLHRLSIGTQNEQAMWTEEMQIMNLLRLIKMQASQFALIIEQREMQWLVLFVVLHFDDPVIRQR